MSRPAPTPTPVTDASTTPLPGEIVYSPGRAADYDALVRHHYLDRRPATFCQVRVARYVEPGRPARLVGVAVLSWPVPMIAARNRHFAVPAGYRVRLRFANAGVRTISRVIVHPQFRALGVATRLVRDLIAACPTRYVESVAAMGRYATFFRAAGMGAIDGGVPDEPAYFLCDRAPHALDPFAPDRHAQPSRSG